MLIGDTGHIFIEKRHPVYPHVVDFLVSCCEPVSRTEHMEQYRLDSSSLSAASAEGTYSIEMIRNVLRYLRQDERTGEAFLDLTKLSALEAWAVSRDAELDPASYLRCLQAVEARPVTEAASSSSPLGEVAETGKVTVTAATTATVSVADRANEVNATLRERPLVSLAARDSGWQPAPLPPAIERALAEETGSSKVRIVLQPRLRRFAPGPAGGAPPYSHGTGNGRDDHREGDSEDLCYFVLSSDREQLERVVSSSAREYLEPVLLHGATRWILSDVDRGAQDLQGASTESGRPAALRRLYDTGACYVGRVPPSLADGVGGGEHPRDGGTVHRGGGTAVSRRVVYKAQVKPGQLRSLKDTLFRQFGFRADCFYDHLQDPTLHVDNLRLVSHVRLRPYQTASLERFQRGSKAHQGVVVLPCGAGKTLTGIGAAAVMRKSTIVMCINNMSVFQWQREFLRWTHLTEEEVTVCTAREKSMPGKVFITTYSMLIAKRGQAVKGAAAQESEEILQAVRSRTWGLLLLDEVHTAVARNFQRVLDQVKHKCVLGLSATLLREDDRIENLRHLVGPKLYEANWLDLTRAGFLARAECAEVQCPMPAAFYSLYCDRLAGEGADKRRRRWRDDDDDDDGGESQDDDDGGNGGGGGRRRRRSRALGSIDSLARVAASCNPYKLWCTQALLEFHRNRSPPDKVILFCDYLADVRFYAYHLHLPFMDQGTSESERTNLLRYFQLSDTVNAIILTRVGDVALDLPCASVIIQISGLGGSQRQEAQRLGRILRPKPPSLDNTCSYFYTLVSQGTHEVAKGYKRQRWLRDQGFACRVLRCEQVLRELDRVSREPPCCVGPPQWWYQAPTGSGNSGTDRKGCDTSAVESNGSWWVPFSLEASSRIQESFSHGEPTCVLEGRAHLGPSTPRPPPEELGGAVLGPEDRWVVHFSSADAPRTFGVVVIGADTIAEDSHSSPLDGPHPSQPLPSSTLADHSRVRRITFGQLRRPHDCLAEDGPCLPFALAGLNTTIDEGYRRPHKE